MSASPSAALRAAFEQIAASADQEQAEEAYGEFEEVLDDVLARVASLEAALEEARRYVAAAAEPPGHPGRADALLARVDALLGGQAELT